MTHTPSQSYSGPSSIRIWALLHYLDWVDASGLDPSDHCRLHHMNCALRGNWKVTSALVDHLVRKGFVLEDEAGLHSITKEGRALLVDLRRVFDRLSPERLVPYLRTLREPTDYPK